MSYTAQGRTRERILGRARELFNQHGVDSVAVRDLARDLGLSPGNVSYWFPRKVDLVRALLDELAERNERGAVASEPGLGGLMRGMERSFAGQLEYRGLTESMGHVLRAWPELAPSYRQVELARRRALADRVRDLASTGALRLEPGDVERLVGTWSLVARSWLGERRISYPDVGDDAAVGHYLALVAHGLLAVASTGARAELRPWLDRVLPGAAGEPCQGEGVEPG